MDFSLPRPTPIGVDGYAKMAHGPGIQQGVSRAGIETIYSAILLGREDRDVGDATDIGYDAAFPLSLEYGLVEGGREGGSLTAGGHIPTSEIGDRGDAGAFGDDVGVGDLYCKGCFYIGPMANGLSMGTDCPDLLGMVIRLSDEIDGRVGEQMAE